MKRRNFIKSGVLLPVLPNFIANMDEKNLSTQDLANKILNDKTYIQVKINDVNFYASFADIFRLIFYNRHVIRPSIDFTTYIYKVNDSEPGHIIKTVGTSKKITNFCYQMVFYDIVAAWFSLNPNYRQDNFDYNILIEVSEIIDRWKVKFC